MRFSSERRMVSVCVHSSALPAFGVRKRRAVGMRWARNFPRSGECRGLVSWSPYQRSTGTGIDEGSNGQRLRASTVSRAYRRHPARSRPRVPAGVPVERWVGVYALVGAVACADDSFPESVGVGRVREEEFCAGRVGGCLFHQHGGLRLERGRQCRVGQLVGG